MCLTFKKLEDENLGVILESPISRKGFAQSAIEFADDVYFCANNKECTEKMQNANDHAC